MTGARFSIDGDRLIRRHRDEILWIEPWGEHSLRVRSTRHAAIDDSEDWALLPAASAMVEIQIDGDSATVRNGRITATIDARGWLTYSDARGVELLRERWQVKDGGDETSAIEIPGRRYTPILGGDYSLSLSLHPAKGERIYGLGQRQIAELDMKGCVLELAQRNSQASVPFAVSNRGYGFLWNNPAVGRVSFAKNVTEWTAERSDQFDYWITAGDTPADIVESYVSATGKPPMMPEFATGFWQCKLRYKTQDELLSVAREYKRRGLPISVIVVDFFHWPQQGDWKFDAQYWPDPAAMVAELAEMGIELMVSIWPTVDVNSENYDEMDARGLLVRTERGTPTQINFMGNERYFDATNPEAREFVWGKAKANYGEFGIRTFWLDEAEPDLMGHYDWDLIRYHAGPALKVGNVYPLRYAQTFFEGQREDGQTEVLNLIRCAWAGSQRYGALLWSGDVHSTFESLRRQLAAGLNAGLSGIPWWTTDIGGFTGGQGDDPMFRELLVRWFQFGVFCPVTRLHGFRTPFDFDITDAWRIFNEPFGSGAENELWSYGEEVFDILSAQVQLRERLRPYVTAQMSAAHERGTPVMRPLFYDFPEQEILWNVEDQYLFGPDLLVAPALDEGTRERSVVIPAGADWVDVSAGVQYEGGQTILLDAPITRIPVLIKSGSTASAAFGL